MKGIPMKTWEVQAILDNRKTVTRRAVKGADPGWDFVGVEERPCEQRIKADGMEYPKELDWPHAVFSAGNGYYDYPMIKASYRPGDILYVRETFFEHRGHFYYKADGKHEALAQFGIIFKWHPSIHMPREAARIFLRVTDVRVERLQDMTHDSPLKEGIRWRECPDGFTWKDGSEIYCCYTTSMGAMRALWNSTIKPKDRAIYGWEANPWVWIIGFERISKEEATI